MLNRVDPTLIALAGARDVFVAQDNAPADAPSVNLTLTDLGPADPQYGAGALAYGARDNTSALLAGNGWSSITNLSDGLQQGELYISTTAAKGSLQPLPAYASAGGAVPTSLVFGQSSQDFYVADSNTLWGTQNQGTTFTNYASNLSALNITRPTSVEFIDNNGVDALLVGGLSSIANAQSPIAVADSNNGNLTDFRLFGSGLPNALVYQMTYNPLADVLAIATIGRGVFTLYDVTSYFPQALVLQFGLANNNSMPDASFLTDGKTLDGTTFVRPLDKYGM